MNDFRLGDIDTIILLLNNNAEYVPKGGQSSPLKVRFGVKILSFLFAHTRSRFSRVFPPHSDSFCVLLKALHVVMQDEVPDPEKHTLFHSLSQDLAKCVYSKTGIQPLCRFPVFSSLCFFFVLSFSCFFFRFLSSSFFFFLTFSLSLSLMG